MDLQNRDDDAESTKSTGESSSTFKPKVTPKVKTKTSIGITVSKRVSPCFETLPVTGASSDSNKSSGKPCFLRRLIQIAFRSLERIRFLSNYGDDPILLEGADVTLQIQLKCDIQNRILSIQDNGTGIKENEMKAIPKSGFLLNLARDLNFRSDLVEIISKHYYNDSKQYILKTTSDGVTFSEDKENDPLGRGTEVRLHIKEEAVEYYKEEKLKDLAKDLMQFVNFPIYVWATEGGTMEEFFTPLAIWLRTPKQVKKSEYIKFSHFLFLELNWSYFKPGRHSLDPICWSHPTGEAGSVDFKAILFVLPRAAVANSNVELYVGGVHYCAEVVVADLLPRYLSFVRGVVDSNVLPLDMSPTQLKQTLKFKLIQQKLINAVFDMIREIAEEAHDSEKDGNWKKGRYTKFWNVYGKAIKLGVVDDASNRCRLAKFLRFESSQSDGELVSLDQYIERMKGGQDSILYIKKELESFQLLETIRQKRGYEVFYFENPIDESVVKSLQMYNGFKFINVSVERLDFIDDSEEKSKVTKEGLTDWWRKAIKSQDVYSIELLDLAENISCFVETSNFKKIFKINCRHFVIKNIHDRISTDPEDVFVWNMATLLYQYAITASGFLVTDYKGFADNIFNCVKASLDIS